MAQQVRAFEIDQVSEDLGDQAYVRHHHLWMGFQVKYDAAGVSVGKLSEPLGRAGLEAGHEARIEHAAGATSDCLNGEVAAADRFEEHGDTGEPRDACTDRDVVAV